MYVANVVYHFDLHLHARIETQVHADRQRQTQIDIDRHSET